MAIDRSKLISTYCNAELSQEDILNELDLSKASLYRLLKKHQLNQYRVGLMAQTELPSSSKVYWHKHYKNQLPKGISFHIELARAFSKKMESRFELRFLPISSIRRKILNGQLDFGMCDMTMMPGWNTQFNFSKPYILKNFPRGTVYSLDMPINRCPKKLLQLGVVRNSVHHHIAKTRLAEKYKIVRFAYHRDMLIALQHKEVDCVLDHPDYINSLPDLSLQLIEEIVDYGGQTAFPTKPGNLALLERLNQAIDELAKDGTLPHLERIFCN